jgi:aldehyde dehydrogenase (NAD+)
MTRINDEAAIDSTEVEVYPLLIDGKEIDAASGKTFGTANPYTGRTWAEAADRGPEDVDRAVAAARAAFDGAWGALTGFERAELMHRLGRVVADNAELLGRLEVNDSGKLLREMVGQVKAMAGWYHYFAGIADKLEGRSIPTPNPDYLVYTTREPVGVVAAITPWNSPLMLLTWKLAPALAAGCTMVVKPSEHSPISTLVFASLLERAGFPPGVLNAVSSSRSDVGAALAGHPGVDAVAFTGATATGRSVAGAAAKNLNRATLELGGKSPQVVFADADLRAAANGIAAGVFAAGGQTCMAGSRLIVQQGVHDELVRLITELASALRLGDPEDAATEMGPLANQPQYEKVLRYLETSADEGVRIVCGGPDDQLGGLFVRPTVLTGVHSHSTVVREEIFGPVLTVQAFTEEAEAIRMANDTPYGLAGAVWTNDLRRAHRVAGKIRAGNVWINDYRVVAPSVPFGGFGDSGIGRESGITAVDEYLETRAIWVELSGRSRDPLVMG